MPFTIIRNDITKVKADAIVNTANPRPVIGGGTDTAIYKAAGEELLLAERQKIGDIARGDAVSTPAFGLNAKYIIHTVGPRWNGGDNGEREILHSCYKKSLALAADLECESIAFPLLATGSYEFPKDEALDIALAEIKQFLLTHEMDVTLVVFDPGSFQLSKKLVADIDEYIDEHTFNYLRAAEYTRPARSPRRRSITEGLRDLFSGKGKPTEPIRRKEDTDKAPFHKRPEPDADLINRREEKTEDLSIDRNIAPSKKQKHLEETIPDELFDELFTVEPDSYADMAKEAMEEMPLPTCASIPASSAHKEKSYSSLRDIFEVKEDTFQQRLFKLIDERGLKDTDVYKNANIDRKVFSKIRCNTAYQPKKKTAIALCIALKLNMKDTRDLLSRAGFAISPSSKSDLIVSYFIEHEDYDIDRINIALFEYDLEKDLLGY